MFPVCVPGKKGHDLGEYDPLRQADSDSEDEERQEYQRNGSLGAGAGEGEGSREPQGPDSAVEMLALKTKPRRVGGCPSPGQTRSHGKPEQLSRKAPASLLPYLRTVLCLLALALTMVLVLVCAFLIPCPPGLPSKASWTHSLGPTAGKRGCGGRRAVTGCVTHTHTYI
uniref:Uncharacterized protein n=1 Tax=Callorhinchus milii TaxID=7868 RepID=A0A4W3ISH3_CALMI